MPDFRGPSSTRLWDVRDTFIMLRALSILDFEPIRGLFFAFLPALRL